MIYYIPQLGLLGLHEYTNLIKQSFKTHIYAVVILCSLISYLVVFYFYWKPRPNLDIGFETKNLNLKIILYFLLIVIGFGFAEQPLIDFKMIIDYYQYSEVKHYSFKFSGFSTTYIYIIIQTLLVSPVFEELFFRKFLFVQLLKKNKTQKAIMISSLCFSIIHFETPSNLVPTFIFGIITCLIYLKTKKIIYLIILHFLFNLCYILYSIYGESFFDWLYGLNYNFMYWALFLFGVFTTILGIKKIFQLTEYNT